MLSYISCKLAESPQNSLSTVQISECILELLKLFAWRMTTKVMQEHQNMCLVLDANNSEKAKKLAGLFVNLSFIHDEAKLFDLQLQSCSGCSSHKQQIFKNF